MPFDRVVNILHDLRKRLRSSSDAKVLQELMSSFIAEKFDASDVVITVVKDGTMARSAWRQGKGSLNQSIFSLVNISQKIITIAGAASELPLFVSDFERTRAPERLLEELKKNKFLSYAVLPLYDAEEIIGAVEVAHSNRYFKWRKDDMFLLEQMGSYGSFVAAYSQESLPEKNVPAASAAHDGLPVEAPAANSSDDTYQRLARFGNLLFIKTDSSFRIEEVLGDTQAILGMDQKELLRDPAIWQRIIYPADLKRLRRMVARMRFMHQELRAEIRVRLNELSYSRTLLVRGIAVLDDKKELSGWEGYAIDITDKRRAEDEILNQSKRIEALYEVTRSTQVYHNPALVMLKGLRAIIKATDSDCGLGCFYDAAGDKLEVATVEGLSSQFVDEIEKRIDSSALLRSVIAEKQGRVIKNIQEDPLAMLDIVRRENVKSCMLVPLMLDDVIYGAIVLYCRQENRYTDSDFNLVTAAATQICIASRQAEYYSTEKQQADSLAALYRISHELSKYVSAKEVAERAFPLIKKEFPCKRMWLGVMNEQATHIVGQAGFGPGVRQRLIQVQIELYLRHDFLDEALKTKMPVIVRSGQQMECSGLNSIMQRLGAGMFIIIPLVSLGQVVGVLVVEPTSPSVFLAEKKMPLLTSMANEIATILLARRFEAKMAEADKMRMAGMLASGVAHNFNNLLQAIMGQASLLEMQLPKDSALSRSSHMIIEAAGKGAGLITQLLSFSTAEAHKRRSTSVEHMIQESNELYRSIIGDEIKLVIDVTPELPQILADYGQVQQVMSNLLMNASEAIIKKSSGRITLSAREVKLKSGEVDPELAPGTYVRIDVEDNGVGMDAERQARCFEPFYTSKNVDTRSGLGFSGSGLGLSSVYSIMKQHDGLIAVRSNPGEGSVFSLYFPVAAVKPLGLSQDVLYASVAQEKSDVLLFDLEEALQQTMRPIFESLNLRSVSVSKNDRALELMRRADSALQAVVVDVDKSGYEIISYLRTVNREFGNVLIVILTTDIRRWSRLLNSFSRLHVLSKPLGVWGIHALARRILQYKSSAGLRSDITLTVDGNSIANHNDKPASAQGGIIELSEESK